MKSNFIEIHDDGNPRVRSKCPDSLLHIKNNIDNKFCLNRELVKKMLVFVSKDEHWVTKNNADEFIDDFIKDPEKYE